MNLKLVARLLGSIALLIGGAMVFSLPWAFPALGRFPGEAAEFESRGFYALVASIVASLATGLLLRWVGRGADGTLFRKEAMAVVGLSWVLATVLGALPFYLASVKYASQVRRIGINTYLIAGHGAQKLSSFEEEIVVEALYNAGARGFDGQQLDQAVRDLLDSLGEEGQADRFQHFRSGDVRKRIEALRHSDKVDVLKRLRANADSGWASVLIFPEDQEGPPDRRGNYRIRWKTMGLADCLFESQSGFSTTGATVISDLEDPELVPRCVLFFRSSTHFLGGLGIIVLFVAILGQGSAGKTLMRSEMPGPSHDSSHTRMQHTAWVFTAIYCGLNLVLTLVLMLEGMNLYDALCHAFGTMATGGFSTYNASLGHFDSSLIEFTVVLFMILAGTNFTLIYLLLLRRPGRMFADVEWRTYMSIILGVTALVVIMGLGTGDFDPAPGEDGGRSPPFGQRLASAVRYGLFQVVSIITTTGYGTHDFDRWNSFGRGVLFLLMFVGGCAGSTGGGMKVIRHILFLKILRLEIEQAYHPTVHRPLRLGGEPVGDQSLRKNILVYFGLILVIFVFSWMFIVAVEPDNTWGSDIEHKLIDSASGISATLNNIGPGLGAVGATQNYAHFSPWAKLLFTFLMMLGRLEVFVILVLLLPAFWRSR